MAIIIDIKDAIRKAIYTKDNTINFNFNEILTVKYPYVFFYITTFQLEKAIDEENWRKLTLACVVEYAKDEDSTATELWSYADMLSEALKTFKFGDSNITALNQEFRIADGVLQMTFDLDVYVKLLPEGEAEMMEELELTILKENEYGINTTKI